MPVNTLEELLLEQLRDIYDAEKQLIRALPKMAKASRSDELREAIEEHLAETKEQVSRLEQIFGTLGKPAEGKTCKAMKGLIDEGSEAIQEDAKEPFGDLAIIAAAQRVEHYEISAYGTAAAVAQQLDLESVVELLKETQEEESTADSNLTEIAETLMSDLAGTQEDGEDSDEVEEPEEDDAVAQEEPLKAGEQESRGARRWTQSIEKR